MISYFTPKGRKPSIHNKKHSKEDVPPPSLALIKKPILMMKHNNDFPPLTEFKKEEYRHFPKIPTPNEVNTSRNVVFNSKTELVLN